MRATLPEGLAGSLSHRAVGWGFPFYAPLYRTAIEWIGGTKG